MKRPSGQILVGAIIVLTMLAVAIPALINYVKNESNWTLKEQRTTRAFELAESAVEQGYQQFVLSTTTWQNVQSGTIPSGYNFNTSFTASGGQYEIKLASGPSAGETTITGVGRDTSNNEVRAVQSVYAVPGAAEAAVYALNGATITGNPNVEWGAVMSPGPISATGELHPRFYSAGGITGWDIDPAPPNTNNINWWSYQVLPTAPQIDLEGYKSAAYAIDGSHPLGSGPSGSIYYYSGDLSPGTNNYIDGDLIVIGSLSLAGNYGNGNLNNVSVPSTAWKEYGDDWAYFKSTFDSSAPASFPGFTSTYTTVGKKINMTKVFIHGFLYVGNTLSITGGGDGTVYGSMYCGTVANLGTSNVTVYFDSSIISRIKVKNNVLIRTAWQEIHCSWAGSNATCP